MSRVFTYTWVGVLLWGLLMGSAPTRTFAADGAHTATTAPLVYAPVVGFTAGIHDDATIMGSVLFSSFGSTSTASTNADMYVGLVPSTTTPTKVRVNFANGVSTLSSVGTVSGDCTGAWHIGASNNSPADNAFTLEYVPAPTDRLTVTLINAEGANPVSCTLAYKNFGAQVSAQHGVSSANLLPLMNYFEVSYRRPSNSSTYTNALTSLSVGTTPLGDVYPVTATTTYSASAGGVHLGDGFVISGVLKLGGNVSNCASTCSVELKFGARPARVVVENVVDGWVPHSDWQFAGPRGMFSLPADGSETTIEPLGSNTIYITQTAKLGFFTTSSCSNGAVGDVAVAVTPDAGETITCTFTSAITPSYSTLTVTPDSLADWRAVQTLSDTSVMTPVSLTVRSMPLPTLGRGSAAFELVPAGVSTLFAAPLLTNTKLADLLVLTYSTYVESGPNAPALTVGWDGGGSLHFVPSGVSAGNWQTWDALGDDGQWFTSNAGPCDLQAGGCAWPMLLAAYPNARIAAGGISGVESNGASRAYVDGITVGASAAFTTYDFEPACATYRVFNTSTGVSFCTIQEAIDDGDTVTGNTISVTAGVYTEAVRLDKDGLALVGAGGANATVLMGPRPSVVLADATVLVSGANNTLDGFTITRDGNTETTWGDTLATGVRFEGHGNTLRNSTVTGNGNGVWLASDNNTVTDNDIVLNRVGVQVGIAHNNEIQRNTISDNWTVGVLFRQAMSAAGNGFIHNKLTGNWFAQVEDRGNPDGQLREFAINYFGPAPFSTVLSSTAGQPDDATLIPVQFGGTSVPPATATTFVVNPFDPHPSGDLAERGNSSTDRIEFAPWLCDGTDTSPAPGFQPIVAATCDGAPPDTVVLSGPVSPTNAPSATFVFSGTDSVTPGSYLSFECRIDGGVWMPCASPLNASGLSDGTHTFETRAKDADNATDATPALHTWLIDTVAPDTALTRTPDALTDNPSPTFEFGGIDTATGIARFECRLDGSTWSICTSPQSFAVVSNGTHRFGVRAVDAADNTDSTPSVFTWSVNTLEPDTTLLSQPPSETTLPFATFAFSGTDGLSHTVSAFQCRLDGAAWSACTSPSFYVVLADGEHEFDVQAVNALGITDTTYASYAWMIDSTGPIIEFTLRPSSIVSQAQVLFEFAADDGAGSGVLAQECRLDGGAWQPCASPITLEGLAEGAHVFEVRGIDRVGNRSAAPALAHWTVDANAPNTSINETVPAFTGQREITMTFAGTDNVTLAAALTYECRLDSANWNACHSPIVLSELGDGLHVFEVRAVDGMGSADSTPASASWTVDGTAPTTTIDLAPPDIDGSDATFEFGGNDTGSGVAVFECQFDEDAWTICQSPKRIFRLMAGDHRFAVRAIDRAGNADATPATHEWQVDTSLPNTDITLRPRAATSETAATFAFVGSDDTTPESDLTLECSLDLGVWSDCASPISTGALAEGPHTLQVRATDAGHNVDPSPAVVRWLVDTTPPDTFVSKVAGDDKALSLVGSDAWAPSTQLAFECRWDSGAWFACASPITPTSTGILDVRAIDPAGNVDPSPARYNANVLQKRIYFPWTPFFAP